jgi:formylmethanofuran dehydrogenase subunit B
VVFWGVDPAARYPRFWSRYAPEPAGLYVPDGRRARTVVAVDVGDSRGPADADLRISIAADDDIAVLTALTASILRYKRDPATETLGPVRDAAADDIALDPAGPAYELAARKLTAVLIRGRYVVLVADGEPDGPRDPARAEALLALGHALNSPTRGAVVTLRGGGNRVGADAVLTAQTGYPMAVDFARGYPRYVPHDTTAARAARGDIDAVLIVGAAAAIPGPVQQAIGSLPAIVIGPRATQTAWRDRGVAIDTAVAGIHESGTALRLDDVPLPLRPSLTGPPPAADIVRRLLARVTTT